MLVIYIYLHILWCVGFHKWFDMAYGINKFDKKLLTPYIKHIQTNKQENYTRKLDQSEEI